MFVEFIDNKELKYSDRANDNVYMKQSVFGGFKYFRQFIWVVEYIVIFSG
jgi:hypothetical protein